MTTAATEAAKAAVDGAKARQASWRKCAEHAAALPPAAVPLARVLTDPARAESVKAYETHSGTASSARDTHAHHTSRAAVAGFLVAAIAGIMLYYGLKPNEGYAGPALALVQLVAAVYSVRSVLAITLFKPHHAWSRSRSDAERQRIDHFRRILMAPDPAATPPAAGELPLAALKLEYVRAFLLDDQRNWFAKRAGDFTPSVRWNKAGRIFAALLVTLAGVQALLSFVRVPMAAEMAPALASWIQGVATAIDLKLLSLAGVIGGALQTLLITQAASSLAHRNARSYAEIVERLDALSADELGKARQAVAAGDAAALDRFWAQLSHELVAEHREWTAAHKTAHLLVLDKAPEWK